MHFQTSPRAAELAARITAFLESELLPHEQGLLKSLAHAPQPWRAPELIESLKAKARAEGLWNLFLPLGQHGGSLTNLEYAPVAEAMGHSLLAPELFNCSAPDTGNMELLLRYGSEAQKRRWLEPLLAGEIRSAFCMTEPEVASSDATNMQATARIEGNEVVLDGRKWWSTGIGHPNCRVAIFMGLTDPHAARHLRHSMVLVPLDTPGVRVERMLSVFGDLEAPHGHGEVTFNQVRLPLDAVIGGPGRGFELAQGRLGPGRIHHCMRIVGAAERALSLMCRRAQQRVAFGKPLAELGGNAEAVAEARMAIEQARLLTLKAAWLIDTVGAKGAMSEISQIKVVAPRMAQRVIDQAMQLHGAAGVSDDLPLAGLFAYARILRIADGPDEVHRALVAKLELRKHAAGATR